MTPFGPSRSTESGGRPRVKIMVNVRRGIAFFDAGSPTMAHADSQETGFH